MVPSIVLFPKRILYTDGGTEKKKKKKGCLPGPIPKQHSRAWYIFFDVQYNLYTEKATIIFFIQIHLISKVSPSTIPVFKSCVITPFFEY